MDTLVPDTFAATPTYLLATASHFSRDSLASSEAAVQALVLLLVVVLTMLAVRVVFQALAPIMEMIRTFASAGLAALMMLIALVLVVVVAVGYV